MSQHRNELNREKRGRDRILYVATKVSTQCKEVLSRHENWVAIGNIDNTKKSCRNIRTKLQQEVKLSSNKPLS